MAHSFDITDAENLGLKGGRAREPFLDYKAFRRLTGRKLYQNYLANGYDTILYAYEVYKRAYFEERAQTEN